MYVCTVRSFGKTRISLPAASQPHDKVFVLIGTQTYVCVDVCVYGHGSLCWRFWLQQLEVRAALPFVHGALSSPPPIHCDAALYFRFGLAHCTELWRQLCPAEEHENGVGGEWGFDSRWTKEPHDAGGQNGRAMLPRGRRLRAAGPANTPAHTRGVEHQGLHKSEWT